MSWFGIVRLGLVQTALGAIVILATSTMNRIMVIELALPAIVPGALVALQYAVQVLRPALGHGSDVGGRRTPWIVGGMALLGVGGIGAALSTAWMATDRPAGIVLAVLSYAALGVGIGAAGTSLLVLLAKQVAPSRRAAAATIVWVMMIAGFVLTAAIAGRLLDPFSSERLIAVTAAAAAIALAVTLLAVWRVERRASDAPAAPPAAGAPPFRAALAQVWAEAPARRFTWFVFVSMLAYSAQELTLEPFAGAVFGLTPGGSARLAGTLHGGVLLGMIAVGLAGTVFAGGPAGSLRGFTIGGCVASAAAVLAVAAAGLAGPGAPLNAAVFLLGVANGTFAVAAIGSMMQLAGAGHGGREGVRLGLWGAAQGVAFACGGLLGPAFSDIARATLGAPASAYATVYAAEAALFLAAALIAIGAFPAHAGRALPRLALAGRFSLTSQG